MALEPKGNMYGSMEAHEDCLKTIIANHQEMMQKVLDSHLNVRKHEMNSKLGSERHLLQEYKKQINKHHEELQELRYENIVQERAIEQLRFENAELECRQDNVDRMTKEMDTAQTAIDELFSDASAADSKYLKDVTWLNTGDRVRLVVRECQHLQTQLALAKERLRILEDGLGASKAGIEDMGITVPKLRAHYTNTIIEQAEQIKELAKVQEELMKQLDDRNAGSWDEPEQEQYADCYTGEDWEQDEEEEDMSRYYSDADLKEWWEPAPSEGQESTAEADYEAKWETGASESAGEGQAEADQNMEESVSTVTPKDEDMADTQALEW